MPIIHLSGYEPIPEPEPGGPLNRRIQVKSQYEWPADCYLQGGTNGLVIVRNGKNYGTAFVEAFPGDTFIRGEGATVAEAETNCWNKYQSKVNCPSHEWETRGYKNGAGFCKKCNAFQSKVFTGEQLGFHCSVCGVGTLHHIDGPAIFCEEHFPYRKEMEELVALMMNFSLGSTQEEEQDKNERMAELRVILYGDSNEF